ALDQLARDEVEPDGLSEAGELLEGIHEDDSQAGDVDRGPERGTAPRMHSVPSSVQPSTGALSTRASSPPTCAGDTKRREALERARRGGGAHAVARLSCFFAAATTASAVKPNFFSSSLSGADAPKPVMPTTAP